MKFVMRWLFAIFFLSAIGLPSATVTAQQSAVTVKVDTVDISQFPQVAVQLHVWDASGLPVPGLTSDSFSIIEDNGTAFHPSDVQSDASATLRVVLALDVSGSMTGQPLADAKVAAARFLDHLDANDQVALVAFSDKVNPDPAVLNPDLEMAFTSNLGPVYDKISSLQAGKNTYLYLALTKAVNMLAQSSGDTRVVLLLTDGENEPPNVGDPEQPIQLAQKANIPVFAIGLGNKIDQLYLRHLVMATGGLLLTTPSSSELASLFAEMAALLKTRYVLNYTSTLPQDGQPHKLTAIVTIPQGQAQWQTSFGPLPTLKNPLPAASLPPTMIAAAPTSIDIQLNPSKVSSPKDYWGWFLAALIALVLAVWFVLTRRTINRPRPEVCAQCGFDLTGIAGSCPKCGNSRRVAR